MLEILDASVRGNYWDQMRPSMRPRISHLTWAIPLMTRTIRRTRPTIRSSRSRRHVCVVKHCGKRSLTWILSRLTVRLIGIPLNLQHLSNTHETILLYLRHNHEQPSLETLNDDLQDILLKSPRLLPRPPGLHTRREP